MIVIRSFLPIMVLPSHGKQMTELVSQVSPTTPTIINSVLKRYLAQDNVEVFIACRQEQKDSADIFGTLTLAFVELLSGRKALIELVAVLRTISARASPGS